MIACGDLGQGKCDTIRDKMGCMMDLNTMLVAFDFRGGEGICAILFGYYSQFCGN